MNKEKFPFFAYDTEEPSRLMLIYKTWNYLNSKYLALDVNSRFPTRFCIDKKNIIRLHSNE